MRALIRVRTKDNKQGFTLEIKKEVIKCNCKEKRRTKKDMMKEIHER